MTFERTLFFNLNVRWLCKQGRAPDLFFARQKGRVSMTTENILHQELSRLFVIEMQLARALLKITESVQNQKLRKVLRRHFGETQQQQDRLLEIGERLGIDIQGGACAPVQELMDDLYQVVATQPATTVRDAMLAIKLRLIKGWEIASYGSAYQCACALGYTELAELLKASRQEEITAEIKLGDIVVNFLLLPWG